MNTYAVRAQIIDRTVRGLRLALPDEGQRKIWIPQSCVVDQDGDWYWLPEWLLLNKEIAVYAKCLPAEPVSAVLAWPKEERAERLARAEGLAIEYWLLGAEWLLAHGQGTESAKSALGLLSRLRAECERRRTHGPEVA